MKMDGQLSTRLHFGGGGKDCPSGNQLQAYARGSLADDSVDQIAKHVTDCKPCADTVTTIQRESRTSADAQIDEACDRFDASWKAGSAPQLEDYLAAIRPEQQAEAFRCLLQVECWYRRRNTDTLDPRPYRERFPDFRQEVDEDFSQLNATAPPQRLGEYELLEKLGEGGMGEVYKARQVRLGKIVALKLLSRDRVGNPHAVARFEREMQAVGRLSHGNLIQAFDARDIDGVTVMVMEYVDGLDLAEILRRCQRLPVAEVCEVIRQAALGLQAAHESGLVHRDIKPSNLMLTSQGQVKILDLGLALLHDPASSGDMTRSEQIMGTADYMAPEQTLNSHRVDIRADIYSLGCTLYALLAGQAPFQTAEFDSLPKKMMAHLQVAPPPLRHLRDDVPVELAAVAARMLAKDPADRFARPEEVAASIASIAAGADLAGLLQRIRPAGADESPAREAAPCGPMTAPTYPLQAPAGKVKSRAGGRNLCRRWLAICAGLGAIAIGLGIWHEWTTPEADLVSVQEATLFVRRGGDDRSIERLSMTDQRDENNLALRPLASSDDFKLHVRFSRPTWWYLAWLDTKGAVQIAAHSEKPLEILDYPAGNQLVSVDPNDPAGLHLLLLLTSDRDPNGIEGEITRSLATVGAPPRSLAGKPLVVGPTRGAGAIRTTSADLDASFVRSIEKHLPKSVQWVQQIYLPTEK